MKKGNIFSDIPKDIPEEIFENLVSPQNCKIERIVSKGHTTPEGEWYDQDKAEFVIVIKGDAEILFEENNEKISLKQGDYIEIPAHKRHRVAYTNPEQETIWLAVHY